MFTIIFFVLFIMIFDKILLFGIKVAWSIGKFLLSVVLLPIGILALFLSGLIYMTFIVLVGMGIVALVKCIVD